MPFQVGAKGLRKTRKLASFVYAAATIRRSDKSDVKSLKCRQLWRLTSCAGIMWTVGAPCTMCLTCPWLYSAPYILERRCTNLGRVLASNMRAHQVRPLCLCVSM